MTQIIDSTVDVLWEDSHQLNEDGTSTLFGYTPNYHRVKTVSAQPEKLVNHIARCKIISIENTIFNAELL